MMHLHFHSIHTTLNTYWIQMVPLLPFHLIIILTAYLDHQSIDNCLSACNDLLQYKSQVYKSQRRDVIDTLQRMFRCSSDLQHLDNVANSKYTYPQNYISNDSNDSKDSKVKCVVHYGRDPLPGHHCHCTDEVPVIPKEFVIHSNKPRLGIQNLQIHGHITRSCIYVGNVCFDTYFARYRAVDSVDSNKPQNASIHIPFNWMDANHVLPLVRHHSITILTYGSEDCYITYDLVKFCKYIPHNLLYPIWCNQYIHPSKLGTNWSAILRYPVREIQLFQPITEPPFKSVLCRFRDIYLKSQFEETFQLIQKPRTTNEQYIMWTIDFGKAIHFYYKGLCVLECYDHHQQSVTPDKVTIWAKHRNVLKVEHGLMTIYYNQ